MAVDRDSWQPPTPPDRGGRGRVAGALGGSRLLDQPRYAPLKAEIAAFVAPGPPLAVEVGFDHGITLLANARAFPNWRWLGVELRKRRVEAVRDNAPDNCLPLRLDARTLFAGGEGALIPDGRVARVDIAFPTPALKAHHLLLTEPFVAALARALASDGVVHFGTDVPAMAALFDRLFVGWTAADPPPRAAVLSRRERVCKRDGLPVWWRTVSPTR